MAHYSNNTWESFGSPNAGGFLEIMDNKLYAYGFFDSIGGKHLNSIAIWDGISWEPFGDTTVLNNIDIFVVVDIEIYNSNYIIGGNIDDGPYKELIQWDGVSFTPLGNGAIIPGGSAWVNCLKTYQRILYIGGYFKEPGFPQFLVAWDGQSFFNPFPYVEFRGQVWDLEVIDNELYFAGPFRVENSNVTFGLAKFDGDNFCAFGGSGIWGQDMMLLQSEISRILMVKYMLLRIL